MIVETADLPAQGGKDDITHPLDFFALPPERDIWLQIEVKNTIYDDFTDAEIAYLKRLHVWPTPFVANLPIVTVESTLSVKRAVAFVRNQLTLREKGRNPQERD